MADDSRLDPMFVALLKFTRTTPFPEPLRDVVTESTAILRGSFADVADGRIVDFKTGAPNPTLTAVFKLQTEKVLKGPLDEFFYAEYPRAIVATIVEFKETLKPADCIFILRAPGWDPAVYRFDDNGHGFPEGATLHAFSFPFGIVCSGAAGELTYPIMSEPPLEPFTANTLVQLEAELVSLIQAAGR